MPITPNTAFSQGQVLTSDNANRFPAGVMGHQQLTSAFGTSATHTTYQDTGMTLTITERVDRLYRISWKAQIYPNGGLQAMLFRFVRGSTNIAFAAFAPSMLATGDTCMAYHEYIYQSTSSGSQTWKVQIAAGSANTQVTQYGDASYPRQFTIEDIGTAA